MAAIDQDRQFEDAHRHLLDLASHKFLAEPYAVYRVLRERRLSMTRVERVFWVGLLQLWPRWRDPLVVVKAETVIRWHPSLGAHEAGPSSLLEVEEPGLRWWSANRRGTPRAHSKEGSGERHMGSSSDPRRAPQAGLSSQRGHRLTVHAAAEQSSRPRLAYRSREPRISARIDGFFRRAHGHIPDSGCFRRSRA